MTIRGFESQNEPIKYNLILWSKKVSINSIYLQKKPTNKTIKCITISSINNI